MPKQNWTRLLRSVLWYTFVIPVLIVLVGLMGAPVELALSEDFSSIKPTVSYTVNQSLVSTKTDIVNAAVVQNTESFNVQFANTGRPGSVDVKTGRYYPPDLDFKAIYGTVFLPVLEDKDGLFLPEEFTIKFDNVYVKNKNTQETHHMYFSAAEAKSIIHWQPEMRSWQWGVFWTLVGLIGLGVLFIAFQLKSLFKSIRRNLFNPSNAKSIYKIGGVIAVFALIQVGLMYWWIQVESGQLEAFSIIEFLQLNYQAPLLLAIISVAIFSIGRVFQSGSTIMREQELTI